MTPELRGRLAAIAAFREELESPSFEIGTWFGGERDGDTITMPWHELSPRAEAFVDALRGILIMGFAWPDWLGTPEGRAFVEDPTAVDRATPEQLQRLATALVREARFTEGALVSSFENGRMAAIARRAAILVSEANEPA